MVASSRFFFQLKRRAAVVGQHLARELGVDRVGEVLGELEVGRAGLAPHHVGHFGIGQAAADGLLEALLRAVEAFDRALAGQEGLVVVVDVAGHQVGGFGVGARQQDRRHAHHVGRQARRGQLGHRFTRRHQHLAAHVAALLHRGQLVLEVHAGGTGFDHRLHQLEGVEHAAEAGFGIGHDRREEVDVVLAFGPLDLVGALEGVVDALDDLGHRVHRVQRLVGVHLAVAVGVTRHLPARQVDGLQAGLDLLHRLVAGERAQRVDEGLGIAQRPQLLGAALGQRVLDAAGCRAGAPRRRRCSCA